MFRRKQKSSQQQNGSKESVMNSSNENLTALKDTKDSVEKILHQRVFFNVSFLGMVQEMNMGDSRKRDTEAQLIDQLEEAQIDGKLPVTAREEDTVKLNVSRHGIKVLDKKGQEVLQRHPLHTIAQIIQYNDDFQHHNVAVKVGQFSKTVFHCFVFQCVSENQAQNICQCLQKLFDAVTMNISMDS
ncbi:integrin beta-1-binding protein 1-like isoform X1 [Argonauta hians]